MRTLAVALLFGLGGTAWLDAQAPTHTGGCMIVEVRHQGTGGEDLTNTCSHYPVWATQDFFDPVIRAAFNNAEVSACGHGGCAVPGANVRVVVVNDASINGWVVGDFVHHRVDIYLTYGLMDFIDSANAALSQQLLDEAAHSTVPGIDDWLATLAKRGGEPCALGMPRPAHPDLTQFGVTSEQSAQMFLSEDLSVVTFILLHELAHLLTGGSCHENPNDVLKMEEACDQIARKWFFREGVAPTGVAAWMITVDDYERLVGPILNQQLGYNGPNRTDVRAMFPGSDWKARSDALLQDWKLKCTPSTDQGVCKGFVLQFDVATQISAIPQPEACVLK